MRRRLIAAGVGLVVVLAVYLLVVRDRPVEAGVTVPTPSAVIGSGPDAVAVGPHGQILAWLPPPEDGALPELPIDSVPKSGRLGGTVLDQVRVLGAAPDALRPHIERSEHGDGGVDVVLRGGIELRFGEPSRAEEKWRAAATVLADPAVTAADYVDLHAPARPAVHGSGHTLPPPP